MTKLRTMCTKELFERVERSEKLEKITILLGELLDIEVTPEIEVREESYKEGYRDGYEKATEEFCELAVYSTKQNQKRRR